MRQRVKGTNTLNGVRNGFVPSCLQSRSEDRRHARIGRWRGEWRAKGELAFPGIGRRGADLPAVEDSRRIAELERKIGQLTMENDFLKKALQHFRVHHPPAVVNGADVCLEKSNKRGRKAKL